MCYRKLAKGLLTTICICISLVSQAQLVDRVAAVVGDNIILHSDIEMQYAQYVAQGNKADDKIRCFILQQLLSQKLLTQQAKIDSVDKDVTGSMIDEEIDRRMRMMIQRAGGQDKLEEFLGRSVIEYKDEIRLDIKEQLIAQKMQGKINEKTSITPLEIKQYFDKIPVDSLPNYNAEVEVGQIAVYPKLNASEKQFYKDKLESIRLRIKTGESFETMARLYSQDPGSAREGGDLGYMDRTNLVKEYAAYAFKLKPGEFSPVFETEFGFHFLQVIDRKGEQVKTRHILLIPQPTENSLKRAEKLIDSIYNKVVSKKMDFSTAASQYSDDNDTKFNGGMMMNLQNVQSRSSFIPIDKLDPLVFLVIDTLKTGQYSKPNLFISTSGKKGYRFFYLKNKTEPHRASLEQDLPKIREMALEDKINRTVSEWFENRRKKTYIHIAPDYTTCPELKLWIQKDNKNERE